MVIDAMQSAADASKACHRLFPRMNRGVGVGLLLFVFVVAGLWLALSRALALDGSRLGDVRLGMTPESVRANFADRSSGDWSEQPTCCAGTSLVWERTRARDTKTRWAKFDFHRGLLVSIRVVSDARSPPTRRLDVTPASIIEIRPGADGSTRMTVLSRTVPPGSCEPYEAQVRQIAGAAGALSR